MPATLRLPRSALAATADPPSNALPIDDAPLIELRPGLTGRYGLCPIATLQPNPHSARVHSTRQISKIARSIDVAGPLSPVIVDERWMVLAGHARVEACRLAGRNVVPIVQVAGASDAQKRAFLIADNRIGEDAGWDRQKLALDMPELTVLLNEAGFEIADLGFETADLDQLAVDFEDDASDPADHIDATILNAPRVLQTGDLLQLGDHRLLVGEARDPSALDRLRDGASIAAAFLDVPYNVRVRDIGGRGRVQHAEFAFASGEMSRPEFIAFLKDALGNAIRVSAPGAIHFVCMDWKHIGELIEAGSAIYGAQLNLVVWNKTNAGQGGLYRSQHELIGVFRVGEEPHRDNVQKGRFGRNRSNVWTYAGVNTFGAGRLQDLADHPTVKPTLLVADAIKDCTRRGAIVLDTFAGSGTTILAGEKVGRRVLAMEIEPKYADVAVRRWQAFTGRDAVHIETGFTFEALATSRNAPPPRLRVRTRTG